MRNLHVFEEAIQKKEWEDVMTEEYRSIMKNEVREIVPRIKMGYPTDGSSK